MKRILLLLINFCLFLPGYLGADHILLVSDIWCPVNCHPDSANPGFMIEIAQRIFAKAGHTVEYRLVPWARAIEMTRNGQANGLVSAYIEDAPDFVYSDNELAQVTTKFFALKNLDWTYTGISSLERIRLGMVIHYDYDDQIVKYLEANKRDPERVQVLGGNSPLERSIKKLLVNRVNVLIDGDIVFWYQAANMGVADSIKVVGQLGEPNKTYIGFSPALATSQRYAQLLSDGIVALRKSGELAVILQKYGLQDWKNLPTASPTKHSFK